jgi:hypothetical protein
VDPLPLRPLAVVAVQIRPVPHSIVPSTCHVTEAVCSGESSRVGAGLPHPPDFLVLQELIHP